MLCQLISLVGLGAGSHPEGLHLEGAESTVDCPGSNINHGYTGISVISVSKRSCLGVIPGRVERSSGPAEISV